MPKIPFARAIRRIRGFHGLWQHRSELAQMVRDARAGQYRISFLTLLAVFAAALYVISPIDLIPDFALFLGWSDDLLIIYFLTNRIGKELERYRNAKPSVLKVVKWK